MAARNPCTALFGIGSAELDGQGWADVVRLAGWPGANRSPSKAQRAGELVGDIPGIRTNGLAGGFEFLDAQMDNARLCLEVVLTGMASGVVAADPFEVSSNRRETRRGLAAS